MCHSTSPTTKTRLVHICQDQIADYGCRSNRGIHGCHRLSNQLTQVWQCCVAQWVCVFAVCCMALLCGHISAIGVRGSHQHRSQLPYVQFMPPLSMNTTVAQSASPILAASGSTISPSTQLPHSLPSLSSYHEMANYSGDIMLAAVFPIHERDQNFSCGTLQAESLQQLEALVYSLKRINDNPSILPGIKLGVLVIDSCDSPHHALEQTIDFIKSFVARSNLRLAEPEFRCADHSAPSYKYDRFDRVLGLIGGQSSEVSLQLANLLRLFQVPQVSYMSTSPRLSDKRLYEYFFRTVPSDTNQVDAIVDILRLFHWTYVSVVYSDTEYGNNGYELLSTAAARYNICISSPQAIDVERFGPADYNNLITTLMHKINARVVVVFTDRVIARKLMTAAKKRLGDKRMDRFVWIASDAWCCRDFVVEDLEEVVEGSISVTPMSYPLQGFEKYFHSLKPENNWQNPWFDEFWQQHFSCTLSANKQTNMITTDIVHHNNHSFSGKKSNNMLTLCDPSLRLGNELRQSPSLHFVRDAFYSFAIAFNNIHRKYCNGRPGVCDEMAEQLSNGANLAKWILQVQFPDEGGKMFKFQNNGDAPPRYTVVNFQRLTNGSYQWKPVGTYMMIEQENQARLQLDMKLMKFKHNTAQFPRSFCSEPCMSGQAKLQLEGDTCCWLCTNCSQYQYLPDEFHCEECPLGTVPDTDKKSCLPLSPMHLSITNWWTICAMLFAIFGMFGTVLTCLVFWRYSETPIIKAAGRELSYLHLVGIFLSFAMTFVVIAKPSAFICALTRFFLGLCYTVCYSAIVTKTNRISRIFQHRSCQRPRFTSPQSQLVITSLLITIEMVINLGWIFYDPPSTVFVYPTRDSAMLICRGSDRTSYLLGLIYPLVLIGFCTVYAFKTRKCPEGFNEARYITFTNYTTCVVWLAFLPLFVMLSTTTPLRHVTLCFLMSVSGTVQLFCLFVPKMYIALWKPEKNTRETVMCGGHYSRSLCNSNVASASTIDKRLFRPNTNQTSSVNGDHFSSSSDQETTITATTAQTDNGSNKQQNCIENHDETSQNNIANKCAISAVLVNKRSYRKAKSQKALHSSKSMPDRLRSAISNGSMVQTNGNICNGVKEDQSVQIELSQSAVYKRRKASFSISITPASSPSLTPSLSLVSQISSPGLTATVLTSCNAAAQLRPPLTASNVSTTICESNNTVVHTASNVTSTFHPPTTTTSICKAHSNGISVSDSRTNTNYSPSILNNGSDKATLFINNGVCNNNNNNNNTCVSTDRDRSIMVTKLDTKAVLENGHERWPSVKLESNSGGGSSQCNIDVNNT